MMTLRGDQTTHQVEMPASAPYQVRNQRSFVYPIVKTHTAIGFPCAFFPERLKTQGTCRDSIIL